MSNATFEKREKRQNGVLRLIFSGLAILLELIFIIIIFTKVNKYAMWIEMSTRILAVVLVLAIYSRRQTSAIKTPWIVLILMLPITGVVMYLLVGLNGGTMRMKLRYRDIDRHLMPYLPENEENIRALKERSGSTAGISRYIKDRAHYPLYHNTDVRYFSEAKEALTSIIADIAKAESYIFMEYHAIEDDKAWGLIQEALTERLQNGIEVYVFYDDMGSISFVNMGFAKKLNSMGIKCKAFNPIHPALNLFFNNRDHRKITVIDGRIGYVGGFNLANEYFGITHPYGQWKDTGIRLEGDAVKSLAVSFIEMWNATNGIFTKRENLIDDAAVNAYLADSAYKAENPAYVQPYSDSPMTGEQLGENVYISIANKAEEYCWFMTPYLIITDEMTNALSLAAKRGVDVRIITPGIPDKKLVYSVTRSFYNALVRNGVRIFEWTPGFCHAKMSVADDCMATCGTINLDYRSLYHHFENACFIADSDVIYDIKRDFEHTMSECREVTEAYGDKRHAYLRLWQLILRLFAGLL